MSRALFLLLGLACSPRTREAASFDSQVDAQPTAAADADARAWDGLRRAARDHRRDAAAGEPSIERAKLLHARAVELCERRAKTPAAIDVLVERARLAAELERGGVAGAATDKDGAFATLVADHATHPELGLAAELVGAVAVDELGFEVAEEFLADVRAKSELAEVRDGADFGLARARLDAVDALPDDAGAKARATLAALAKRTPRDRRSRAAADLLFAADHLRILREAPEIDAQDLHGAPVRLAALRGRVVLVVFWSEAGTRTLNELEAHGQRAKELADRPFALLRVHAPDAASAADGLDPELRALVARHGRVAPADRAELEPTDRAAFARLDAWDRARTRELLGEVALPGRDIADGACDGPWSRRWDVRKRPASFLLDARGRIRFRDLPANELDLSIAMLLDEAAREAKR